MSEALLERFRRGDRRALARLLTLAARGEEEAAVGGAVEATARRARVVAFTGGAGVGKSTLVGRLLDHVRTLGPTVAVLACDPESPLTGGALLGDRLRMPSRPTDDGSFVRSVAASGGHGAVAERLGRMVQLLEAFGFDVVFVETVGAGQGDTAVRDLADVVVLLVQPEAGDDVQWEKAGVLEVADVVVVHKADLPGAETAALGVAGSLGLTKHPPPVVRVSSRTGSGVAELWDAITSLPPRRSAREDRDLLEAARRFLTERWTGLVGPDREGRDQLVADWRRGRIGEAEAATALLRLLTTSTVRGREAFAGRQWQAMTSLTTIAPMLPSDWECVRAIYREGIASGLATFELEAPSWEEWDAAHHPFARLVARRDGEVVGWAALSPVSRRRCYAGVAEVSVYIAANQRGRGVGRELLRAVIAEAERHGIWTLQGATFAENTASRRLQAACGFREIGYRERIGQLHGVWKDTVLTERRSAVVGG